MFFFFVICLALSAAFLIKKKPGAEASAAGSSAAIGLQGKSSVFFFVQENDTEEDCDIKIAGEKTFRPNSDDMASDVNELDLQRRSGNLEKAHTLGAVLSEKIIDQDGESDFGEDSSEDPDMRMQRRLLLTFAAINCVETNIKSEVLQGVVLNVFYDTLKKSLPEFYDDVSKSGSFSFYTLCVRRGVEVDNNMGCTFAMLAGKEGEPVIEELGKALYLRFVDVVQKTILSFDFKE